MKKALLSLFTILSLFSLGQDLTVPDSILQELNTSVFVVEEDTICFKYTFPKHYDSTKMYPVFIGLSGGNQSEFIVDYCYASWFRSRHFTDYFTILPVNVLGKNLSTYTSKDIELTLRAIQENFNVKESDWILAGTSNGGVAAYNFIAHAPQQFHGIIAIPGSASDTLKIQSNWSHLHALNAVGEDDSDGWKTAVKKTSDSLDGNIKSNDLITLKGVGHILPLDFNIEIVYDRYFSKTLGLDGKLELNQTEIDFLSESFNNDSLNYDFSKAKIAFISGPGGSRTISKSQYFDGFVQGTTSSFIIKLSPKEKIKSGGYDYLITKWVKFQPQKYRKRIIKQLASHE